MTTIPYPENWEVLLSEVKRVQEEERFPYDVLDRICDFVLPRSLDRKGCFNSVDPNEDVRRARVYGVIQELPIDDLDREIGKIYYGLGSELYQVPVDRNLSPRVIGNLTGLTESQVYTRLDHFIIALRDCKKRLEDVR